MFAMNGVLGLIKFGVILMLIFLLSGCWWGYALWSGPRMPPAKDCSTWTSSEIGSASKEGNRQRVKSIIQNAGSERASKIRYAMLAASACGQQVIIDDLLEEGVDFSGDRREWPFIFVLASASQPNMLDHILEKVKVDLNYQTDIQKFTVLHSILCDDGSRHENIPVLLKHGADFSAVDSAGRTPLMMAQACENRRSIQLLRDYEMGVGSKNLAPHGRR